MVGSLVRRRADAKSYLRENPNSLVILERSLLSTEDFARANYDYLGSKDLDALKELAYTSYCAFSLLRLWICLVADPATCLERISSRGP